MLYSTITIVIFLFYFSTLAIKACNIVNGVITTVAGIGGSFGFSGDGEFAMSARINYPDGVFADSLGNLFFADTNNHVIRYVDVSGIITTVAGIGESFGFSGDGGHAMNARLHRPVRIVIDTTGNLLESLLIQETCTLVNMATMLFVK
jgi:hypothetical protein